MEKNKLQGAYSQRYSHYSPMPLKDGRHVDEDPGSPLPTPSGNVTVKVSYNGLRGNVTGNGLVASTNMPDGGPMVKVLTVKSGDTVTITAKPNSGFRFIKWVGFKTSKETNPTLTFSVLSDCALAAIFEPDTLSPGGGSGGSGSGGSGTGGGTGGGSSVAPESEETEGKDDAPVASRTGIDLVGMLKKYWWVLAVILVGYYLYKAGKL